MAFDQLLRGGALGHIAICSSADGPHYILLLFVHGEDEDGQLRVVLAQLADDFQAIQPGMEISTTHDGLGSGHLFEWPPGRRRPRPPPVDVAGFLDNAWTARP